MLQPLAPDAPLAGLNGLTLQDFWQLPVSKDFDFQPEYYLGQTVLHKIKVRDGGVNKGEILHLVKVIGTWWNGVCWQYIVEIPASHPRFKEQDREVIDVEDGELEAM